MLVPKEVAFETCNVGEKKVNNPFIVVIVAAMLAGMYIALGFYGFIVVNNGFAHTEYQILGKIIGALVFTVGIILVIVAGSELFTGNCLITLGYLDKRYSILKVLKNLLLVWSGNFIGALIFAVILYWSKSANNAITDTVINISSTKVGLGFVEALMRGILCNILVSLGVYLSYAAKSVPGKIMGAAIPVFLFVLCGYEHSVANMFVIPFSMMLGSNITVWEMFKNLIPVTLGNFIGGGVIIPFAYYFIYVKKR